MRRVILRSMATDARQRMIQSAALLMRERGVQATAFSDVLAHSGAPRGSIYHHFPGGKAQLIEEATRYAGEFLAAGLASALAQDDPAGAVRGYAATWRKVLRDTDFEAGCPIVAAALEGDRLPAARDEAGAAFGHWIALLADALHARGVPRARARSTATIAIASIEGAIVLARAQRSLRPLEDTADEIERLVAGVLEG